LPTITRTVTTQLIVDVVATSSIESLPIAGPFAIQISGGDCNGQYLNCPGSNEQFGSETNCGAKEAFTLDQFGYLHIGTTDLVACQQIFGGFEDFRFLPPGDCSAPDFQIVKCTIDSGHLTCNGPYGPGFSEEFGDIFLGSSNDVSFIANIVPYP
jgi:hypothetical protein